MLETEFALYQSLHLDEISSEVKAAATIKVNSVDGEERSVYRLDVLWHYIHQERLIAGTGRSKFHNLRMVSHLVLTLPHSNADEEQVFSRIGKNKSKFRVNLRLDLMLGSIITFQMN